MINCFVKFVAGSQPRCSSPSAADLPCTVLACGRLIPASLLNAVISRFKVRTVGWPHVGSNEFELLTTKQLDCFMCTMSQCIVLLKDVNFIADASDGWQQLSKCNIK